METSENHQQQTYVLLYQLARAWNHLDVRIIEPLLCQDFIYTSHWVDYTISGASNYINYLTEKFAAIGSAKDNTVTKARMVFLNQPQPRHCVLLTQISGNEIRQLLFLIKTQQGQISHIHSDAPEKHNTFQLTGVYP